METGQRHSCFNKGMPGYESGQKKPVLVRDSAGPMTTPHGNCGVKSHSRRAVKCSKYYLSNLYRTNASCLV